MERAGFPEGSHSEKDLIEILETYPREELFQSSNEELFEIAMSILHLQERQRVRFFVRRDTSASSPASSSFPATATPH